MTKDNVSFCLYRISLRNLLTLYLFMVYMQLEGTFRMYLLRLNENISLSECFHDIVGKILEHWENKLCSCSLEKRITLKKFCNPTCICLMNKLYYIRFIYIWSHFGLLTSNKTSLEVSFSRVLEVETYHGKQNFCIV